KARGASFEVRDLSSVTEAIETPKITTRYRIDPQRISFNNAWGSVPLRSIVQSAKNPVRDARSESLGFRKNGVSINLTAASPITLINHRSVPPPLGVHQPFATITL